jgi:hypothetical protein
MTARAAIVYQHASAEADRVIAEAVGAEVDAERKRARKAREKRPEGRPDEAEGGAIRAA